MGHTGLIEAETARPVRIELLVIELMNRLLEPGPGGIDRALDEALARLGVACGLDRTFLFRVEPDGSHRNSHEWVAPGVARLKDCRPVIAKGEHRTWHAAFALGKTVLVANRNDLPADMPERAFLEEIGVVSSLMLPLMDGDRLYGVIGFDSQSPDCRWGEGEAQVLASLGRAVSSVVLRAEAAQAEATVRSHLEATLRALPDLVIELCPHGYIVAVHSEKLPWLASLVKSGIGRPMVEVLPDLLARTLDAMMRDPPEGHTSSRRRVGLPSLVSPHWYDVSIATLPVKPDGCAAGYVAVIRDLSSSQATSEMTSYREGQFTAFFEMCPHPILLNDFDSGELLDANRAFKQVFGIDPQRDPGIAVRNLLPADAAWVADATTRALQAGLNYGPIEASLRRADGSRFPAVLRGFMSVDPNGRRLVWAMIEDVTAIREKEAALVAQQRDAEATRARLVSAIEALDDGFAIFDAEDRLVLWNEPYARVFADIADLIRPGALYDDLLRAAIARGVFGAEGERDDASLQRRLNRPLTEIWDSEDEFADGRLIWVRERSTPSHETVGVYEDVTQSRFTDIRLQQVVESGDVTLWDWDYRSGLDTLNERWRDKLGPMIGPECLQAELLARLHPDDLGQVLETKVSLSQPETNDFDLLCRVRHSAGHWLWLLSRGRVLARLANGAPWRISGVTLDVTARYEAEQRLSRLIDGARVGTWEHDLRTGETVVNDRWAEIIGFRAAELNPLSLQDWFALVHPADLASLLEHESRCFAAEEWQYEHELRMRHRDGHLVWILSRNQAIEWDVAGKVVKTSGVNIDISAVKAMELALARERDALARMMETSVSGILAIDGLGKVVFANAAAEAVLGRPVLPGDALGELCLTLGVAYPDGKPMLPADDPLAMAMAGQMVKQDVRLSVLWPDGTRRILSLNLARLSAPDTDLAVLCSMTDVTDAVEAEDRLRAAMTAAEAASRAKSDFLAAMSHEMRTPLNGVLGMVEVLDRRLEDPAQSALLQVIRESGEHLLTVINDILDLAKIEAGHLVLAEAPFDLADVLLRVAAIHRLNAGKKGLRLVTMIAGEHQQALRLGDEQRLIQILHNLIGNAIKFTDTGEVRVDVDASRPDRLLISVADTGIGMSKADMARAFEDFTQLQSGVSRSYGGTGLGLGIVRRLANLMAGSVALAPAPGRGLLATVDLAIPVADAVISPQTAASSADLPSPPDLPPMTVLAAEDNASNRIILSCMLQALGVEVRMIGSGDEVLQVWTPGDYSAVLLDISMPGLDGVATLQALRQRAAEVGAAEPRVIAVTANAMTHQVREYLEQGFVDVVAKPLRMERLSEALRTCLDRDTPGSAPKNATGVGAQSL
ncbi:MAG: hypothetical protein B7Z10_00985 [Rhodobacterales bacterium 32-66-7]|nr:MAG: hypothetical protein B7Z10_00985 [Rhodobacterales bacterium 32-66-7]